MMTRRVHGRSSSERGASLVEYAGLIVLAALILGSLVAIGIPQKVSSGVGSAICRIFDQENCGKQQPSASGGSPNAPARSNPAQPAIAPHPTDALQVRLASFIADGGRKPNPQARKPPPQDPESPPEEDEPDWGPSTGAGPGNPGVGRSGDLPRKSYGGEEWYEPPKRGNGKPVKAKGENSWVDKWGRIWKWDTKHRDHWDVTDPKTGKHINVNPDGSIARKPKTTASPQVSEPPPPPPGNKGTSNFWKSVAAVGAVVGGVAVAIWWGAKVLSPVCGPAFPLCALAF